MGKPRSSKPSVRVLRLAALTVDEGLQPRAGGLNPDHLADLVEAIERGDELPPLVVYHDRTAGKWWLSSGFHRFHAYLKAGRKDAPCEVREGTRAEALVNACGSNAQHGLRRSNDDKRRAVELLLAMFPEWSNPLLALKAAVSDEFVRKVRGEVQVPTVGTSRVGMDGKSYPATRPAEARTLFPVDAPKADEERPAVVPREPETCASPNTSADRTPPPQLDSLAERFDAGLRSLKRLLGELEREWGRGQIALAAVNSGAGEECEQGIRWVAIQRLENFLTELGPKK